MRAIAERLAELDPAHAAVYRANAEAGAAEIEAASAAAEAKLAPLRGRRFLVMHDAYQYFEAHFGLTAAGAVAAGDASPPGPRRVARVEELAEESGAVCLFKEPQLDAALARRLAETGGLRQGELDPLGAAIEPGPGHYPALIAALAEAFETCLGAES